MKHAKLRQSKLENVLYKIFPNETRKGAQIVSPSGNFLELDFWIPNLKLAFEFQEDHHYVTTWYADRPHSLIYNHDRIKIKKEKMGVRGETLVTVPVWWDGSQDRPELLPHLTSSSPPISPVPPSNYFREKIIPDIGELMLASYSQSSSFNPKNWWLSEKYDGVRVCWNHLRTTLYGRRGEIIDFPGDIQFQFPSVNLDGELWFGRNSFGETLNIKGNPILPNLDFMRLLAFDSPPVKENSGMTFEDRFKIMFNSFSSNSLICISKQHLNEVSQKVIKFSGEGVMARKNNSSYVHGRSDDLIKIKAQRDSEGMVVDTQSDGPNGNLINAQGKDIVPKLGQIVSFVDSKYGNRTSDRKLAIIVRIRPDLEWDDLLTPKTNLIGKSQRLLQDQDSKPKGYWLKDEHKRMRDFFSNYCESKNLNPLKPEVWYSVRPKDILDWPGIHSVLYHYGGSLSKALFDLFPNIGLQQQKFDFAEKNRIQRQQFFESFANKRSMNPYVAENWYNINPQDLLKEKGGWSVMDYYGRDLRKALLDVYPEIDWKEENFCFKNRAYWNERENRKQFFVAFAEKQGFNPHNRVAWTSVTNFKILQERDGAGVLRKYGGSLSKAIEDLFGE